jgi:tRNA modification GTPase
VIGTDICVRSKVDLRPGWGVSAKTGAGIDEFLDGISLSLIDRVPEDSYVHSDRDVEDLAAAVRMIGGVLAAPNALPEISAERLREATDRLSHMLGKVDIEDILDHVFTSFCIGK